MSLLLALLVSLAQDPGATTRLAFDSERDGRGDIFVMYGEGSHPVRLTPCSSEDRPAGWLKAVSPAWSPDGERIAFHVYREEGHRLLAVIDADGSDLRIVVGDRDAVNASWSPDGSTLVFTHQDDLWMVEAEGGEPWQVTSLPLNARSASWSTDGRYLAFSAGRFAGGALLEEVHVLDLEDGEPKQITSLGGEVGLPSWSPDGDWLVFNAGDDDSADLCVARPDGSELRFVTRSGKFYGADWSADGKELYATGFVDENVDVYAVSLDGKNIRRLSDHPGWDGSPAVFPGAVAPPETADPKRVNVAVDVAELDARNAIAELREGTALMNSGNHAEAAVKFREVLERDPGFGRVWFRLGVSLQRAGEYDEALAAYERAVDYTRWAARAYYNVACIHAKRGKTDAAFSALGAAREAGYLGARQMKNDPDLESLRADPRFVRMLEQLAR